MEMIDTHCHLDLPVFDHDRDAVWERARRVGVRQCVIPAIRVAGFAKVAAMASPQFPIALGLHPWYLPDHPADAVSRLEGWLARCRPVAIGEMGLDHKVPPESHAAQQILFIDQLLLAKRHKLPLLLHVRGAHDTVCSQLRKHAFTCGGIVHAFNGSLQQAHAYLDLGFRLGFGGVVTHDRAQRVRRVAAALPDHALVLETDAPDLPPAGHTGERNEPAHLAMVVATLAGLRGVEPGCIIEQTTQNATTVLQLIRPA
ncbi:MAG: TatD family hydrolase [Magnetococcales bacterium]|nr:TatD family hydrolase [Magnetococcales bacterium]